LPRHHRQPGFVLLLVLLVLAMAGTLLGLVAAQTSRRALEAGLAVRDLQRRWAVQSLESLCIPHSETILTDAAREGELPPTAVRTTITLGGTLFELFVADEQAKVNVNQLAASGGDSQVRMAASALSEGHWVLQVIPRPVEMSMDEIRTPPMRFVTFEQIFSNVRPTALLGTWPDNPGPARCLTCWGNGRVNLTRATATVLRTALADVLTEYELCHLAALRDESPDASVQDLIAQLDLEDKVRKAAERQLTDSSTCHSLWIVAHEKTRDWYRLTVCQRGDAENDSGRWTFVW